MISRPAISHETHLTVMGEQLLFQTNHQPFVQTAVQAFHRFPQSPNHQSPITNHQADRTLAGHQPNFPIPQFPNQPLTLQLFLHSPADQPDHPPPLAAHSHGHLLTLSAGQHNFVTADLKQGYAFGYITDTLAQNLDYIRYTFIESAVQAMLGLSRGFVAIHAAAVVKNNTTLLLCGPSGTGKSTLAYACLRSGFKLLSEDVIQAKVSGKTLRLWGMPWKLHLLAESLPFFPELQGKTEKLLVNGKWKIPLDLTQNHLQSLLTNATNGRLVFLKKSHPNLPAALTHLTPEQARASFEAIWSWESGWQPQYEQRLNELLTPGAHHLQLGRTPEESVSALEQIIAHETPLRHS
jgi:hypothetical protein